MDAYLTEIILGLIGLNLLTIVALVVQHQRLGRLLRGNRGNNLEDTLNRMLGHQEKIMTAHKQLVHDHEILSKKYAQALRGCATIRFNPFQEQTGNQSYATALINERGDGVIFSSLYARDRMRVFAKPIHNFTSSHELTKEEHAALTEARSYQHTL